jgi:UDP-glucose 4-epimerase
MKKYKNILVTGGAGFIGSHLVNFLILKKFNVTVLDNFSLGEKKWINKNAKIIEGDIVNIKDCKKACKNIDIIFHFAAMSRAGPSLENMSFCIQQNVIGTENILKAAHFYKVKKLIYAGSATFYGNNTKIQKENYPGEFINPYSLTKYLGEQLCLYYSKKKLLSCNILRFFNVYGPRQPLKGQYALVIGVFLYRMKKNLPLIIHGKGFQKRDFIYVNDVLNACFKILNSNISSNIFNVGSGKSISILDLAKKISKNIKFSNRRKGDSDFSQANIGKIKKYLNWSPQINIDQGLNMLINKKII